MNTIKVNFVDFWGNFCKTNNYFYNLLSTKYNVLIDDHPDLLFFSVDYGKKKERERFVNHKCKKIFFTGENVRPNFDKDNVEYPNYSIGKADIAFTFDYSDDARNYRFPLWAFIINWFNKPYDHNIDPAYLIPLSNLLNRDNLPQKSKFCNFVFSNNSGRRLDILNIINNYKHVDCAGRLANNHPRIDGRGDQIDKMYFLSNYKFTISAENSKHNGYVTEKIIHPLSVGSIPIYWGSESIQNDFNEESFINCNSMSDEELIQKIIDIDNNNELYNYIIRQPIFKNNIVPEYVKPKNVLSFIESIL